MTGLQMRRENLESSQRTIWYYPEAPTSSDPEVQRQYGYVELLYCHMFIEDIYTQIFPIGGRSRNEAFKVRLSPASESVEKLVAPALTSRDRGWRAALPSAVADFFRECSETLVSFGETVYEIVYLSDPGNHEIVAFEFQYVRPLTVKRRHGQLVQIVPQEVATRRHVSPFIALPIDRVLFIRLPRTLQRCIERTLETLAVLSQKLMPDFAVRDFPAAAKKYHYESGKHFHSQKLALAEAGKAIGWNARGLFQEETLEFYSLRRQLLFEEFKIRFRNSMLESLNYGLKLAAKEMGFSAEIVIEGLPTLADVEEAMSNLESGATPFAEILKPFLVY